MRYEIRHAVVQYAADKILDDVSFEIRDTEKIAIVGRNGCGKTTFLKLIAGELEMSNTSSDEEAGIFMAGKQRIGYLKQISFDEPDITVEEEILKVFAPVFECEARMEQLHTQMEQGDNSEQVLYEYANLQSKMDALAGYTYRKDMETIFQRFGFPLSDLQRPIGQFSGGQQTRIAFVKLLLSRPDIMLLDEPTNHLDMATIEWLEGYLKNYNRAVVIVSHDRMFLDHISDVTYEIEYHKMKRYAGNYSFFVKEKEIALEKQERDYERQQEEIKRLTEWIEKWKNTPTKVTAARSKQKMIDHMELIEKPRRFDTKAFHAQFTPKSTSWKDVLTVQGLRIGYDEVLSRVDVEIHKGDRIAVIGENGKGKSTLLRTVIGEIPALGGKYTIGTGVEWGYFDQQEALAGNEDPKKTVLDEFWDKYPSLKETEVRNVLGSFLFTGDDVFKQMGQLSGGEKVRLALCRMFMERPNFLILDEPTNHMDIVGKQALETMLKNYEGTVLFVSHDRYFIKEVATGILDFQMERVKYYPYCYEDFLQEKAKEEAGLIGTLGREDTRVEKEPASGGVKAGKGADPTLADVFDKKKYYNPGKIESRLRKQIEKHERELAESEERMNGLKLEQMDPAIASNYDRLMELQKGIDKEEALQESLLERLMEEETELDELLESLQ